MKTWKRKVLGAAGAIGLGVALVSGLQQPDTAKAAAGPAWDPTDRRIKAQGLNTMCLNAVTHYPVIIDRCTDQPAGNWNIRYYAFEGSSSINIRHAGVTTTKDGETGVNMCLAAGSGLSAQIWLEPCDPNETDQVWLYSCKHDYLMNAAATTKLTWWEDLSTSVLLNADPAQSGWDFVPDVWTNC